MSEPAALPLRVVLIGARNPLNIGAAARAMSNFGFFDLRLVRPYDVAFREAVSGVGAGRVLENARVHEHLAEALDGVSLVAGATGIDFVLLVVAADDGVMPQTIEHLAIVDLLGVERGLVALTKTDLVSPERLSEAKREIANALSTTRIAAAEIVPVSAVTGAGIDRAPSAAVPRPGVSASRSTALSRSPAPALSSPVRCCPAVSPSALLCW